MSESSDALGAIGVACVLFFVVALLPSAPVEPREPVATGAHVLPAGVGHLVSDVGSERGTEAASPGTARERLDGLLARFRRGVADDDAEQRNTAVREIYAWVRTDDSLEARDARAAALARGFEAAVDDGAGFAERELLLRALGESESAVAVDVLRSRIATLAAGAPDAEIALEAAIAVDALMQTQRPERAAALSGLLEVAPGLWLDRIISALGSCDLEQRRPLARRLLGKLEHENAGVRAAAAYAVRDLGDDAVRAVAAALSRESIARSRIAMVEALGASGSPLAVPPLQEALSRDEVDRVRMRAVDALARIGGREVGLFLERIGNSDTSPRVRQRAAYAAIDILEN